MKIIQQITHGFTLLPQVLVDNYSLNGLLFSKLIKQFLFTVSCRKAINKKLLVRAFTFIRNKVLHVFLKLKKNKDFIDII